MITISWMVVNGTTAMFLYSRQGFKSIFAIQFQRFQIMSIQFQFHQILIIPNPILWNTSVHQTKLCYGQRFVFNWFHCAKAACCELCLKTTNYEDNYLLCWSNQNFQKKYQNCAFLLFDFSVIHIHNHIHNYQVCFNSLRPNDILNLGHHRLR